jgi:uncharacterized protein
MRGAWMADRRDPKMPVLSRPLTEDECEQVADVLGRFHGERAMNLEMLDGFFAALICCPDLVPPSEYLPEIWGGAMVDSEAFHSEAELQTFLELIMQHWNAVVRTLNSDDVYVPLVFEDDYKVVCGNDWANGFARGMELRRDQWSVLFEDEAHAGALVPILALAYEHHPDPKMRPYKEPMSPERREQLIVGMAAAVPAIYRYFAPRRCLAAKPTRKMHAPHRSRRKVGRKVGRNEPCPCGSGKTFKKCCAAATMH